MELYVIELLMIGAFCGGLLVGLSMRRRVPQPKYTVQVVHADSVAQAVMAQDRKEFILEIERESRYVN